MEEISFGLSGKNIILMAFMLSALSATGSELLKATDFKVSIGDPKLASVSCKDDKVTIKRSAAGSTVALVYKDIDVQPDTAYFFSVKAKAGENAGLQNFFLLKLPDGKWDGNYKDHSKRMKNADGTITVSTVKKTGNAVQMRLILSSTGKNSVVEYSDFVLRKINESGTEVAVRDIPCEFDGGLDSPFWKNATVLSDFHIYNQPEKKSPWRDEVRLNVHNGYLYLGFRLEEPNVSGITARKAENDQAIYNDDSAQVFFSTGQSSLYQIIVNARGSKYWYTFRSPADFSDWFPVGGGDFQCEWDAKARIDKEGWTCTIRVKLADLFGKEITDRTPLMVNFVRHRRANDALYTWVPLRDVLFLSTGSLAPIILSMSGKNPQIPKEMSSDYTFTKKLAGPRLMIAGEPVLLEKGEGIFELPSDISVTEDGISIAPTIKDLLRIQTSNHTKVDFQLKITPVLFRDRKLNGAQQKLLEGPEAFSLDIRNGKVVISARTQDGVLRGMATYILLARWGAAQKEHNLPELFIADAPAMKTRGWMIEGNTPEQLKKTVDAAYLLRMNQLLIKLDSWGGPVHFPFEYAKIGAGRFTKESLQEVFRYARERGIEPVPYHVAWGRVQFLTGTKYEHYTLPPAAHQSGLKDARGTYRNIDAANPLAIQFVLGLQKEIIETLSPQKLHIGFDELFFGDLVSSPEAKKRGWKSSDYVIETLNVNNEFLNGNNVRMCIWSDMLNPEHHGKHLDFFGAELMKKLPRNMIIYHCRYNPGRYYMDTMLFKNSGYEVIGCPWSFPGGIAGHARTFNKYGLDGMCLTSWSPTVPDQMFPELRRAAALTAFLSWSPQSCELEEFKFIPDLIFNCAAQEFSMVTSGTIPVVIPDKLLSCESGLSEAMNLPADSRLSFLNTEIADIQGEALAPFRLEGKPAALIVKGNSDETITIPVEMKIKQLLFLHSTNGQKDFPDNIDFIRLDKRFNAIVGEYEILFESGIKETIKLRNRVHIGDFNSSQIPVKSIPALFGTLNGKRFFNLPVLKWRNPHPDEVIKSIRVIPGKMAGMDILLFGLVSTPD